MKNLLFILCCLPSFLQAQSSATQLPEPVDIPAGIILVDIETVREIARKYGIEDRLNFTDNANRKLDTKTGKMPVTGSLEEFDSRLKKIAFEHKKAEVLMQFFNKDYQDIESFEQYISLKRHYARTYSYLLKEERTFQEDYILSEEKNIDNLTIFTKKYPNGVPK